MAGALTEKQYWRIYEEHTTFALTRSNKSGRSCFSRSTVLGARVSSLRFRSNFIVITFLGLRSTRAVRYSPESGRRRKFGREISGERCIEGCLKKGHVAVSLAASGK